MARSQKNLNAVFTDTANAIRAKKSSQAAISPLDFADQIASIPTGITPTGTKNIDYNGTFDVTNYANANVNVPTYTIISDYNRYFIKDIMDDDYQKSDYPFLTDAGYGYINPYPQLQSISMDATLRLSDPDVYNYPTDPYWIPGYHNFDSTPCLVIGGLGMIVDSTAVWDFTIQITYSDYTSFEYTESELETMWESVFEGMRIYDLEGNDLGYISSPSVTVQFYGGC